MYPCAVTAIILALGLSAAGSWAPRPEAAAPAHQPLPASREGADQPQPLHKGFVDLASGLYIRENDDLVVPGLPSIVLRRTYLANYRVSREFGIGATHPGEEVLFGDPAHLQWAALMLAKGTRINFRRTTPGESLINAVFVHDESASEWRGAELRWTFFGWTLQKGDGTLLTFKGCNGDDRCSIIRARDPQGRMTYYRRDAKGTLLKIDDGTGRSIAFTYDDQRRIARADASTGEHVTYEYDSRGRLAAARSSSGSARRYTYTDLDELATISEPGTSIENIYANGRCVRQFNRYPDGPPLVFDFSYVVERRIMSTRVERSDESVKEYTWDDGGSMVTERLGRRGLPLLMFKYDRDPTTHVLTSITVACPDLGKGVIERSRPVPPGQKEEIKGQLMLDCVAAVPRR